MKRFFFIILLHLLTSSFLIGQEKGPIDVSQFQDGLDIESYLSIIPDKNYEIAHLLKIPSNKFSDYSWEEIPEDESIHWLKIEFINNSKKNEQLVIGSSRFDFITLFFIDEKGNWKQVKSGTKYPNSRKEIVFDANSYLDFIIPANSKQAIYLKIENQSKQKYQYSPVPFTIYHKKSFIKHQIDQTYFTYFFLGAILIMTLYHLFIYFQLRSKIYIYYVLNNLGILAFVLSQTGLISKLFFESFSFHENLVLILGNFAFVLYLLFVREFLKFKELSPKQDKFLKYLAIGYPLLLLTLFVNQSIAVGIGGVIALSLYGYIFATSFNYARKGLMDAKLFFAGNLFYSFGIIISILQAANLFPYEIYGLTAINYVEIGTIFQLTLFALTVGFTISKLQNQIIQKESEQTRIKRLAEEKRLKLIEEKIKS